MAKVKVRGMAYDDRLVKEFSSQIFWPGLSRICGFATVFGLLNHRLPDHAKCLRYAHIEWVRIEVMAYSIPLSAIAPARRAGY